MPTGAAAPVNTRPTVPARSSRTGATSGSTRPVLSPGRFSATAFAQLVRAKVTAEFGHLPSLWSPEKIIVGRLDQAPGVDDAWVFGLYATVLNRIPDAHGLKIHVELLQAGGTPQEIVGNLMKTPEALRLGSQAPEDLNEVFVTGAYLAGLGRLPDAAGLAANRDALAAGTTPWDVLEGILASREAQDGFRFPPMAEQRISQKPGRSLSTRVATAPKLPVRTVLGQVKRRERSIQSAMKALLVSAPVARTITARAAQQLDKRRAGSARGTVTALHRDLLKDRTFQWRKDQRTWQALDSIMIAVRQIDDRLDALEKSIEQANERSESAPGD